MSIIQLDPEQWAEVGRFFERAGELPPEARPRFLERECLDDRVRGEVQSLLQYDATHLPAAEAAIAAEAAAVTRDLDPDQRLIGAHLGPYRVDTIVGHGGMGAVYRANRDDGEFRQQVAIKLVRAAVQSPQTLQRFKQERQILARLAHPNIARLLDGGSMPDGVPYLVMEFIEGEAITTWCDRRSLTVEQRLRVFLRVCGAVEFAHRNLVVHTDLKPANILVSADGTPKLLDFGIAKILVLQPGEASATTVGVRAITPDYAAPEQVRGDPVSPAVDVYALGLILYEILTGRKARMIPDLSPVTVAHAICQTEPIAPAALRPELAGDLDHIIRMAIRVEPERRYASAADLARDIQLHLQGHPVTARPDTIGYRTAKLLRRRRAEAAGALIAALVLGGLALVYRLGGPGRTLRASGVTQLTQTGHAAGNGLVTDGSYVYFVERSPGQWRLARVSAQGGTPQPLTSELRYVDLLDISPDRTTLLVSNGIGEDVPLWTVPTGGGPPHRIGEAAVGHTAGWSPDGKSITFARGSELFRVNRDGSGLHKLLDTPGRPYGISRRPAPGPDVLRFAVLPVGGGGYALWEARSDGTHLHPLLTNWHSDSGREESTDSGAWMAGGYYLFRSLRGPVYSLWAIQEGRRFPGPFARQPVPLHSTTSGVFWLTPNPDGKRVFFISGQERRQFVRYHAPRREFVPYLPGTPGRWISFSPDGRWIAYTTVPGETLWRSRSDGSDALQLSPPSMQVAGPRWSPDGARIVFGGSQAGQVSGVYVVPSAGGAPERITSPAFTAGQPSWSPDGGSLMFVCDRQPGASGKGLCLMNWKTKETTLLPESERWQWGSWSPDGRHIAATDGEQVELFDTRTQRWTCLAGGGGLSPPYWSRDGKSVYYQDLFAPEQPIFRATLAGGRIERMMSSRQIPQSDLTGYLLAGMAPGDVPIGAVVRKNLDIYALELALP